MRLLLFIAMLLCLVCATWAKDWSFPMEGEGGQIKGSADLNGDGKAETLVLTWKDDAQTFTLQVGNVMLTDRLPADADCVFGFRDNDVNKQTPAKELEVVFGPSPMTVIHRFYHYDGKTINALGEVGGYDTEMELPGAGFFYVRTWELFYQCTKKYTLNEKTDRLEEVPQPFYYVGTEATVQRSLPIYAEQTKKTVIANLRPKSTVIILINLGDWYLLKTTTGLTGCTHQDDITEENFGPIFAG